MVQRWGQVHIREFSRFGWSNVGAGASPPFTHLHGEPIQRGQVRTVPLSEWWLKTLFPSAEVR